MRHDYSSQEAAWHGGTVPDFLLCLFLPGGGSRFPGRIWEEGNRAEENCSPCCKNAVCEACRS